MIRNLSCISCKSAGPRRTSMATNDMIFQKKSRRRRRRQWNKFPVVGLDNAGKTSLMKLWIPNSDVEKPASGTNKIYNVYKLKIRKTKRIYWRPKHKSNRFKFLFFDMNGDMNARLQWSQYCQNVAGIFYVIDCSAHNRISNANSELKWLLNSLKNTSIPVVLLANKQDLPNCLTVVDLIPQMNLSDLSNPWIIIPTSAVNGQGRGEALESMKRLSEEYLQKQKSLKRMQPASSQNALTQELKDIVLSDCSSCDFSSSSGEWN